MLRAVLSTLVCLAIVICFLSYLLMIYMPGDFVESDRIVVTANQQKIQRLDNHIRYLSDTIGERLHFVPGSLNQTAEYIADYFNSIGYQAEFQRYGPANEYSNVVAELHSNLSDEIIIIGAHYDTVLYALGADDNASGVAALLELAYKLREYQLSKTIRFVAFANEEAPFYGTDLMGSHVYAKKYAGQSISGMISLEMLGYYSDEPDSQKYPWPIKYFYPDTGNFIGFVGNLQSRGWMHQSIAAYRKFAMVPAEGFVAPVWLVADVGRSDQRSFWPYGIPAFMVTDTANFRSPYYHFAGDVIETLNLKKMAQVVSAIEHMLIELANEP